MSLSQTATWLCEDEDHTITLAEADAIVSLFASRSAKEREVLAREDMGDGLLPLHKVALWAKGGEPRWTIFEAIFNAYPAAAEVRDGGSWLPLHLVALHWANSAEGLRAMNLLLQKRPGDVREKSNDGWLPLNFVARHWGGAVGLDAMRMLLLRYPEGAAVKSNNGFLAIHHICRNDNGASLEMGKEKKGHVRQCVGDGGRGGERVVWVCVWGGGMGVGGGGCVCVSQGSWADSDEGTTCCCVL